MGKHGRTARTHHNAQILSTATVQASPQRELSAGTHALPLLCLAYAGEPVCNLARRCSGVLTTWTWQTQSAAFCLDSTFMHRTAP